MEIAERNAKLGDLPASVNWKLGLKKVRLRNLMVCEPASWVKGFDFGIRCGWTVGATIPVSVLFLEFELILDFVDCGEIFRPILTRQ